ncbi:MAG: TM2 domain-containing protein [Sphingomonas sp.]
MALTTAELSLIEQRVANDGPSPVVAYLLWFFLGWLSGHRFYLGRPVSAVVQILSYLILIGVIWWIIDAFLISGMIREKRDAIRDELSASLSA